MLYYNMIDQMISQRARETFACHRCR